MESPLKKLRESWGLKQSELAILLNYSKNTLSSIEAGVSPLTEGFLIRIAALGANTDELVELQRGFVEGRRNELLKKHFKNIKGV